MCRQVSRDGTSGFVGSPDHSHTSSHAISFPQAVYCWGAILENRAGHTHSLAAPLNSVAGLCVQAPLWLGSVSRPCPPLVLPEVCGWALWLGLGFLLSSSCPPLVLVLAAPLNSVARLCVRVLSSCCPCLGRAPELCGWECGRKNSDVNAD